MDTAMEYEFASPKRRKLVEEEPSEHSMQGVKKHAFRPINAASTEIPTISAESVTPMRILQFGHSEEDRAQVAQLSMKKAHRDKIEIAAHVIEKQEEEKDLTAAKMQE